jgi:hypothetical protein
MNNIPLFKNLEQQITSNSDAFNKWLNSNDMNTQIPVIWENNNDKMKEINTAVYSYAF